MDRAIEVTEDEETDRTSLCSSSSNNSSATFHMADALAVNSPNDVFQRPDQIRLDNCTENHIGPKINAEICHINLNGESPVFWEKIEKQLLDTPTKVRYPQKLVKKTTLKKPLYILALVVCLLIVTLIAHLIMTRWDRLPDDSPDRPGESSSTAFPDTTTPSAATKMTTVPTTTPIPVTVPTTTQTPSTPTDKPTTEPTPYIKYISRQDWSGKEPPSSAKRGQILFRDVVVDNLSSILHCNAPSECSILLRQLENEKNASLEYNFMVDDNGMFYEGRGWQFSCDEKPDHPDEHLKIGFIGEYMSTHLTIEQTSQFQDFLYYAKKFNLLASDARIKAQCCRGLDDQGPNRYVMCDLWVQPTTNMDACIFDTACDQRTYWEWLWLENQCPN